jgi:hypothetical protein
VGQLKPPYWAKSECQNQLQWFSIGEGLIGDAEEPQKAVLGPMARAKGHTSPVFLFVTLL